MKAHEFIAEVFDSSIEGTIVRATNDSFLTKADIGGRPIRFSAVASNPAENKWDIGFSELVGDHHEREYGKTGSGSELQVFSFVISSLKDFISRYSPDVIEFTSDESDENRSQLYDRMIRKIKIPGYSATSNPGSAHTLFTITKNKA